jgi:hypothetical protein
MEIRGKTISYSSYKRKERDKIENILSGKRNKSSRACLKGVFFLQVYRCKSGKSSLKRFTREH